MVQTRSQKKLEEQKSNKEKMAIHTLLEISRQEPEKYVIGDSEFSQKEIDNKRLDIAREYCKNELMKLDKPMHDLVKYCPYNGTVEQQIEQSIHNNNMDVYWALKTYKNQMEEYNNMEIYLKNNFNNIVNNIDDKTVIDKLKNAKNIAFLKKKKEELEFLKEIKYIKEIIKTKKEISNMVNDDIQYLQEKYDMKMNEYNLKYN